MSKHDSVHEETYRGCTIKLEQDDSPESPREWSNVGTMACWHQRYNLGDEQPKEDPDDYVLRLAQRIHPNLPDDVHEDHVQAILQKHYIILPLYLYDHSGITIQTRPFSCPWDSGQVGIIYCTMNQARGEWGEKHHPGITDGEIRKKAVEYMTGEVETYDSFLTGDVVGWVAEDPDGEHIESCWGFYPDDREGYGKRWDYPIGEAKADIDRWAEEQDKESAEVQHWAERDSITTT